LPAIEVTGWRRAVQFAVFCPPFVKKESPRQLRITARLFVPLLFHDSRIKLYTEGALTKPSPKREMAAQKSNRNQMSHRST
jgi:hypothetical protein